MERTITVKGTGSVTRRPDMINVSITLKSRNKLYDQAMEAASVRLDTLQNALAGAGFQKQDLKTASLTVETEYRSVHDKDGNYHSVFQGYCCSQRLSLDFDFDTVRLASVLSAIACCISEPELSIRFFVKDKAAVSSKLLKSAAHNAREKAEILTKAAGVKLGDLLRIDYNWAELDVYSNTNFGIEEKCAGCGGIADMDIVPEDICVTDTATFVWQIDP